MVEAQEVSPLSTVCLLYIRMVCISPEKLLQGTTRRNRLTFAFYPSWWLCPCLRHALRLCGCFFFPRRIVAVLPEQHDLVPCGLQTKVHLFSSHIYNINLFFCSIISLCFFSNVILHMFNLSQREDLPAHLNNYNIYRKIFYTLDQSM